MAGLLDRLQEEWLVLEQSRSGRDWTAVRLSVPSSIENVVLAVDRQSVRHLLIPTEAKRYPANTQSALGTTAHHLNFEYSDGEEISGRFLDIWCSLPKLNDQFDRVIESVFDEYDGERDLASSAVRTVNTWRRLFSTMAGARELSVQEKFGVFAELSVLERLVHAHADFTVAWWTGPSNLPHDFELPGRSIEVKATTAETKVVTINGLRQLEENEQKPLNLVLVQISEDPDGLTVGDLLELIAVQLPDARPLRTKCASLGVFGTSDDSLKLSVAKTAVTQVIGEFPRLTENHLPVEDRAAFANVKYELKLNAIREYFDHVTMNELVGSLENDA